METVFVTAVLVTAYFCIGFIIAHEVHVNKEIRGRPKLYRVRLLSGLFLWPLWAVWLALRTFGRFFAEVGGEILDDLFDTEGD